LHANLPSRDLQTERHAQQPAHTGETPKHEKPQVAWPVLLKMVLLVKMIT